MGLTEIKDKVEPLNSLKKESKTFSSNLKKHQTKQKYDNIKTISNDKANAINYFDNLSESDKVAFKKELQKKKVRDNYLLYLKYIYGDNYKITDFHRLLASICQSVVNKIEKGEKVKICISCPPQLGKSITVTQTLPSWFLGRNPDLRCITTSYNADVAEKFGDEPRQQVKKYGKDLFGIEISDSQDNKTIWNIKDHQGGMYSTGIFGALTSNQGALIIVDDPIKSEIEAQNPKFRDDLYNVFNTSVLTRERYEGCGIIVIHTRWHEDDLIGRLSKNEEWLVVNIPLVWEKGIDKLLGRKIGEVLCPERGITAEWASKKKKEIGSRSFYALYQGKPFVESGEIVNRDMIKTYSKQTCPPSFEELVLSCDLSFGAKKSEDPNGIGVWGRVGANHYLLKVINKKLSFTEVLDRIRYLCSEYPLMKKKIVESKASGSALIDTLNREIGGFVAYDPKMFSKEDRLKLCLPYFESGNVFFPDETVDSDSEKYIEQMVRFPRATHDEIVDITTQYLLNYEYKYSGHFNTDSQFAIFSKAIRGFK